MVQKDDNRRMEKQIQKFFEYIELFATCYLCATKAIFITLEKNFKDEKEGREMIEEEIENIISMRWNDPNKKEIS